MHPRPRQPVVISKASEIAKASQAAESQASRYFRDAHKSIHVYAHENDATTLRSGRPAAE